MHAFPITARLHVDMHMYIPSCTFNNIQPYMHAALVWSMDMQQ